MIAPLRLADPEVTVLLRPGALIDVIAADPEGGDAHVVAAGVRVLTVAAPPAGEGAGTADGALVLVDVDAETACWPERPPPPQNQRRAPLAAMASHAGPTQLLETYCATRSLATTIPEEVVTLLITSSGM